MVPNLSNGVKTFVFWREKFVYYNPVSTWSPDNSTKISGHLRYFGPSRITIRWEKLRQLGRLLGGQNICPAWKAVKLKKPTQLCMYLWNTKITSGRHTQYKYTDTSVKNYTLKDLIIINKNGSYKYEGWVVRIYWLIFWLLFHSQLYKKEHILT